MLAYSGEFTGGTKTFVVVSIVAIIAVCILIKAFWKE